MSMGSTSRRPSAATEALSPEEREARLKQWLQRKELLDKGLELFVTLDPARAESEQSLTEAATCAYSIDKMVGNTGPTEARGSAQSKKGDTKKATKTMQGAWMRWTREHHTFSNIRFNSEQASKFSATVREFLDQDGDDFILMSLKYSFPAKPKPNEKPRPMSADQILQNDVFNKECKRVWKAAKTIVESGGDSVAREQSAKGSADRGSKPSSLFSFGLPQLRRWLEEDEDKAQERAKEIAYGKSKDKKVAYEGFIKNKDSLRIKLPPQEIAQEGRVKRPQSAPRMNFGGALKSVRPKAAPPPLTTAELMAGSGLKYAHATKRGNQGMEGDLELSRKKLLDMGFVDKNNIEVDPEEGISANYAYRKAIEENETLQELRKNQDKSRTQSGKAFDQWLVLKGLKDQALKYLTSVPPPALHREDREEDMRMSTLAESKSGGSTRAVVYDAPAVDVCIEVGKALKRVDRGLLAEWLRWSSSVIPAYNATALWDSFYPTACDVHGVLGSQVRETFLRILKPGLDFKAAFKQFAEKKIRRREASENRDFDKEEKDEIIRDTKLGKKDMTQLLLELGVSMKPHEISALIDAFDANGDGVVTMQEFLDFTGPTRTTNAGALASLNQKCCWRTTCKVTGMGNAYTVCMPTKSSGLNSESKEGPRESISGGGRTEIIRLANGDKRLKVDTQEREKRLNILRRYAQLPEDKKRWKDRKGSSAKKGHVSSGEEDYETDEFNDDGGDYGDDFENTENKAEESCQVRSLTDADRREGLKYLEGFSREARQEQALQSMLSNGSPPTAPQLWAVNHKDPDAVEDGMDFSTELLMKWKPKSGELVSFFSLECSGAAGSGKGDHVYKEVYRDPPDANPGSSFTFTYRMSNLSPGTTYLFRMRGMNGYGPGDFVYKTFTTYPGSPLKPRIIKITSSACTLRWVFSAYFMKRLADLKNLFTAVDRDGSGNVSRDELSAALERKSSQLPDLAAFLNRAREKLGISDDAGYAALFDNIEGDDDEEISWAEFEKFFVGAGWCDPLPASTQEGTDSPLRRDMETQSKSRNSLGGSRGGGTYRSSSDSLRNSRTSLKSDSGRGTQAFSVASKLTYIVEECESEFDNVFKEILRTTAGEGTLTRLEPGKSYRYRVYARNADGGEGPKSETVIVHAMLETPQHPTVVQRWPTASIAATSIALQWRDRRHGVTSRDKGVIKRMIGDWTGAGEESGGVSVETAFAKYDRDGNGEMDISEFAYLLTDLGVECSKERLDFAFNEFDTNHDGVISFAEFSAFWRRDEVTYTLKRSEPIPFLPVRNISIKDGVGAKRIGPGVSKMLNSTYDKSAVLSKSDATRQRTVVGDSGGGSNKAYKDVPTPITSYRAGTGKVFEERGLIPNQLYHFKLRYVGSRVNSQLSSPLVVMSAPLPPIGPPAVIRYSGTTVKLKWYPPKYGSFKFEVQLFTVSSPTGSTSQEWTSAYNGQENTFMTTTLAPESVYKARVFCINYQGIASEPSEIVTFKTLPRSENKLNLTTKNVSSSFTIECVEDICVGDIILMTERLFAKDNHSSGDDMGRSLGPQASVRLDRGVRMDMSVTSFTGEQPAPGAFIGERTIACHVVRDNYRTYREATGSSRIDAMRFCRSRRLWLEVIWEQSSTPACKQYKLSPGTIIERTQSHFEQFEVFRTVWTHEEARLPFTAELESLSECFLVPDI